MGVTQAAGLSLQWFRNRFASACTYDELTYEASHSPPGANGLFWLPYLMGERTPHLDANARGAWIGLTASHERADLVRSILEGVCYSQKDAFEIISRLGAHPSSVRLSGGGAKSPFWQQLFADILNQSVATLETQEGSAYGAALLAMISTAEYRDAVEISKVAVKEVSIKAPQRQSMVDAYQKRYEIYQSLYPALKAAFQRIGQADA